MPVTILSADAGAETIREAAVAALRAQDEMNAPRFGETVYVEEEFWRAVKSEVGIKGE